MVYHAASLATRRVVAAGDFAQLSAPVKSDGSGTEWLSADLFGAAGVPASVSQEDHPPHLAVLSEQGRMDPAICAFVGDLFYGGILTCSDAVRRRPLFDSPLGRAQIQWVDTSALGRSTDLGRRTTNSMHAEVVEALLQILLEADSAVYINGMSIAVLTPFRAQEEVLRQRLKHHRERVRVSTVHRF